MNRTTRSKGRSAFVFASTMTVAVVAVASMAGSWPRSSHNVTVRSAEAPLKTALSGASSRPPLDTYVRAIKPDMFTAPQPPTPTTPVIVKVESPKPTTEAAAPPPDPLADFVYSGTVTVDGRRYGLIENRKTREGHYVSVGDTFENGTIASIDERTVAVQMGGVPRQMALNEDYKLVPLDRSADYLVATAGGAPGAPGSPGGVPGGPGGPGGPFGAFGQGGPGGPFGGRGRGGFPGGFPGGGFPGGGGRGGFRGGIPAPAGGTMILDGGAKAAISIESSPAQVIDAPGEVIIERSIKP